MSPELGKYLALERAMIELDRVRDSLADEVRDSMDPIWYALSDEERAWLDDRRNVGLYGPSHITSPVGDSLFSDPVQPPPGEVRSEPIRGEGWKQAA